MSTNELDDPFAIPSTPTDEQQDQFSNEYTDDFSNDFSDPTQNDDQPFLQTDDHFPEEPAQELAADQEPHYGDAQVNSEQATQAPAQPKPFLKTPFGMAICGVAVLGVVGVGVTAYKVTNPPMSDDLADTSSEVTAAPVKHDPAPEVDFGGGQQEPIVSAEAREVKPAVAAEKTAAQVLNLTEVKPQGVESLPAPVQAVVPVSAALPEVASSAREDELKKLIAEQQQTTEDLQKTNAALTQALSKLSKVVEKSREEQIVLSEQVVEIKESLKPAAKPVVAQATSPSGAPSGTSDSPATAPANPLTDGRTRIPGLQIVNTTPNGDMSIVKKISNGRVFTMFKGENIGTVRGNFKITAVLEKGSLLLLGDKYYIDTVAEEWSSSSKAAPEPKPEPKAEAKKAPVKREPQSKPEAKAKPTPVAQCRKFTLNAVYDAGKSFGVVSNSGDFNSYKVDDNMPGVGVVKGLDAAGNLIAGDCVIESVY